MQYWDENTLHRNFANAEDTALILRFTTFREVMTKTKTRYHGEGAIHLNPGCFMVSVKLLQRGRKPIHWRLSRIEGSKECAET